MTTTRTQAAAGELRPRLLRLALAAKYLGVSPGTLRRIIWSGGLSVIKISDGNNVPWLLDQLELDSWIEQQKTKL